MPLQRRIPKYGFKNINRKEYKGINISALQALAEKKKISDIDVDTLISAGLAQKNSLIKILGNCKTSAPLNKRGSTHEYNGPPPIGQGMPE